jgi:prolipoprotein diacylglyceryltransferase/protein-S-isoprenylcysteine O-methyltransferase Ste14
MAIKNNPSLGKLLYGSLFAVLLPIGLAAWTRGVRGNVGLRGIHSVSLGALIGVAGALLWSAGILALRSRGGGLPMNAYPPPRLVTQGVYAAVAHPIYAGFVLLSAGVSIAFGSAAGLWLVCPMLAMAAGALWWGYERIDLRARLGTPPRAAWLGVPYHSPDPPSMKERLGALFLAIAVPALAALMLRGSGLVGSPTCFSRGTQARAWAALALMLTAALAVRTCADLRKVLLSSWVGSLLLALVTLALPSGPFGGRLPVAPDGALLALIGMTAIAALLGRTARLCPAAQNVLALIGGLFLIGRGWTPSPESLLGAGIFTLASARWALWRAALHFSEKAANCWRESDFGSVRILHIGWLAALPAFGGAALTVVLLGPGFAVMTVWAFLFMLIGSALWAQIIEGSPTVSRPYGFFGAVAAIVIFALIAAPLAFNTSPWAVLGAFATVAPWAQGLARLRCFANGCCHGAPCPPSCGVVYRNPHTRVVRLVHWGGVPIHPTQLYSLIGNALIGVLMMRLWAEGAPLALITGLYFALMGLARFVEEAYRGEPQTPVYAGLRLYQWMSIGCLILGAMLTTVSGSQRAPAPVPSFHALWAGFAAGAVTWVGVSIDFPGSKKRFARLA